MARVLRRWRSPPEAPSNPAQRCHNASKDAVLQRTPRDPAPTLMRKQIGPAAVNTRLVLLAGFGGLLILTALAGADGIKALQGIERSNDRVRDEFRLRTRVLERTRSDLYRSGADVRDYLLEPEPGRAEGHRYTLLETRRDMDAALEQYRALLSGSETGPFQVLTRE